MSMLTTTAEVAALCADLAGEPYVAVDTEFMRDRTYFPKLGLVQLAGAQRQAAIDPLAKGIDLAPLWPIRRCSRSFMRPCRTSKSFIA